MAEPVRRGADGTAPFAAMGAPYRTPLHPPRMATPLAPANGPMARSPGVLATSPLPQMGAQMAARAAQRPSASYPPQAQPMPHMELAGATQHLNHRSAPSPQQPPVHSTAQAPQRQQSGYPGAAPFVSSPPPFAPPGFVQSTPILVDVTPRALVVETSGGFTDILIARNAKIPCERTRVFATARDGQTQVRIRVAQGEAAKFADNTFLGELELSGIRPSHRGDVTLEVSFELDEGGTLRVRARDRETRIEAHAVMQLTQGLDEPSIMQMVSRIGHMPVSDRHASGGPVQDRPPAERPHAQGGYAPEPSLMEPIRGAQPGAAAAAYPAQGADGGRGSIVPLGPAGSSIPKPRAR